MQQKKLIELLFNEGETVCVSPNKLGYHSISQDMVWGENIKLQPPPEAFDSTVRWCHRKDIQLIAINPISGFRRDENVTAFRSFLIELDDGGLKDQFDYIKSIGLPYSVCIFSGSKSLHFAVTLNEDLPDEDTYRLYSEWLLRVVSRADQKTKNPSRSIRFAGNLRRETGKEMKIVDFRGRIPLADLMYFLSKHPDKDPRLEYVKRSVEVTAEVNGVPDWIWRKLASGIDESKGRNNEWFGIFMEFAKAGYDYESMVNILEEYFTPERDFTRREWKTIAKSACKRLKNG
jgi:hypothetical protein